MIKYQNSQIKQTDKEYIDKLFSGSLINNEVQEARDEITMLQNSQKRPLVTGMEHMDYFLFDGLTNKMVFIGSRPAMGKTHNCARVIKNLINEEVNPANVSILRLNWEMQTKSLLLRSLKQTLKKPMREIVTKPFTAEEMPLVEEAVSEVSNDKITNLSNIYEGDALRYLLDIFGKSGDPNSEKVVLVDHLHILTTKERIDNFLSICNEYKLKYPKMSFIFYFQLNRTLESLWKGKDANPRNFRPNSLHIYNTDNLYQYADIITTMVIPQVVNLETYAVVNKNYCQNIAEHFVDEGETSWVKLEGRNRVYFDYIKIRMVDDFEDPRLYCEILSEEKEHRMEAKDNPLIDVPAFMKENKEDESITQDIIMGETTEKDDLPF